MDTNRYNINMVHVLFVVLTLISFNLAYSCNAYALTINDGTSFTNTPNITLQLNKPVNTYQVGISNESATATIISNPSATIPWTLSAGDGLKTVNTIYYYWYYYTANEPCGTYCCGWSWTGRCTSWCTSYCPVTRQGYSTSSESATITLNAGSINTGTKPIASATNPITNKIYVANQGSNTVTVINGATNITTTVTVGTSPTAVAVNPATNKIYVVNTGSNDVTVIDGATNSTTTVAVGTSPYAVAVNPATNKIYVANASSNDVTVIDGSNNNIVTVAAGLYPRAVAVNPVTNRIYVANFSSNNVTVIDGSNNDTATLTVGANPIAVAVNPATNKIYVANNGSASISIIDGATNNISGVGTGAEPRSIAVNPVTNKIYVSNYASNNVTVIDGASTSTSNVTVGTNPIAVALNPITNITYVANYNSGTITVIDGATNSTASLAVGVNPVNVSVNPVSSKIYVNNYNSGNVIVIDTAANSTISVATGTNPQAVAVNPATNKAYVANYTSNDITAIDGASNSTTTIAAGTNPIAAAMNPITNKAYVVNYGSNNVTVIDGATHSTSTVTVGVSPTAVAVNQVKNKIYIVNAGNNSITVIDGATNSTETVFVGTNPSKIAVNQVTDKIYVTNSISNNVTVIDGATLSTSNVAVGMSPSAVAVNQVTNKIYVANTGGNSVTVIDGTTNNTSTIAVGTGPRALATNSFANKVYVANYNSNNVTVIDGATNSIVTTITVGAGPLTIAVNPVTNRIYAANATSNNITIINGITNSTATAIAGTAPQGLSLNLITNKLYVANSGSNNVTVITEQMTQTNPLVAAITPLPDNISTTCTPAFEITATNGFTPNPTGALTVYYQLDSWQGSWLTTQPIPSLPPGPHILYAFATDAQSATSTNTGLQSSPLVGTMAAYQFLIAPAAYHPPVITEGISTSVSMSKDGTPTPFTLTLHATDIEGDTLTWNIGEIPAHGTATASGNGNNVVVGYTPTPGYVGLDSFIVQVDDSSNARANIMVNITVMPTYTVNFTIAGSGTLTGTVSQTINKSESATSVTAVPDSGYHFVNWTEGATVVSTRATLAIANVTSNRSFTANFAPGSTTTITTGTKPLAVAVNPVTNKVYVANQNSNNVTVIDGATNSTFIVATGTKPKAVAVNPSTNKIYVANDGSANVTVIDGATNSTATVVTGANPGAIAVNPVTNKIYVANLSSNSITVIDGVTNSTLDVTVGNGPYAVAVNPVTNRIYVTGTSSNTVTIIDGANNNTTSVTTSSNPRAVAVNPVTNKVYVANYGGNNVTVIDGETNGTTTVVTGNIPYSIAVNTVTNKIYTANWNSSNVTVIDGATNSVSNVATGANPYAAAVNQATNKIYVANSDNSVTVIDGTTNSTTSAFAGSGSFGVAVNPITNKVYVTNSTDDNVTVIDGTVYSTANVDTGTNPKTVAVNPVTNKTYVANNGSNSVTVIDGTTNNTTSVSIGTGPYTLALNPVTNKIYVTNQGDNSVTVIDGATNSTTTVTAGTSPCAVAVNPVTNKIYVANWGSYNVTVIDGTTNSTTTVAAGTGPWAIAVNLATNKVYVLNQTGSNVTVIDGATNSSITTVTTGTQPYAVAINPATNKIYVANQYSNNVTVIDGASNSTTTVVTGTYPRAIAVNPFTNKIYVANQNSNNVTIIDGSSNGTTTVDVGTSPRFVAVNPVTNRIYVSNEVSNNVTVIDGTTSNTTTLEVGTSPWAVAVNPVTNQVIVTNFGSANVSVITEQITQANPLTTDITPLVENTSNSSTPSFTLTPTNGFTPNPTGALTVYYQLDTWQGPWLTTQPIPALSTGLHILYAFATDNQAATSTNTGFQSSPLIGTMAAYPFLITSQAYTVNFASDGNGTLTGTASQSIDSGSSTSQITAVPATDYHFLNWTGSGGFVTTTDNPLTVINVTASMTITANFAINTYNVTASPAINGSLDATTPSPAPVNHGSTTSFKFNADSGYYVSSVSGCSGSAYTNSDQNISSHTYTTGTITGICTVSADFALKNSVGPTFSSASYYGGTGDEHGTGIAITNGVLFTVGYVSNGGILARYSLPPSSTPAWSVIWPNIGVYDSFYGVAVSGTNVYTAGWNYNRTVDLGGDKEPKGLVAQFPLTGATGAGYGGSVWDVQTPAFPYLGGEGLNAILNTVEAANDFVYATGSGQVNGINNGRLYLSKLNAAGSIIWTVNDSAEMVGDSYSRGLGLAGLNNYIYVAGAIQDSGTSRPYLRKYDQSGTLTWTRKSALSGSYQGVTTFGGAIYAVGQTSALDFLIEKWDEAGNVIWTKQYDRNSAEDILNGVTGLGSSIYAAGSTTGSTAGGSDAALLQIDPATGDLLSTTLWGGVQDDSATGIATDGQDLYLVGNTASYGAGGIDMVLLRYTIPGPEILLTSTKTGNGSGTITSSPAGIDCGTTCSGSFPVGNQVTLTAAADTGSAFSGWSGEGCSGTGTCVVTMDAARSISATFDLVPLILTLNKAGTGTGTVAASPAGASGTPLNGTLINNPAWVAGRYGNGISLSDGQYVNIPAPAPDLFNITGDLTIAMWVNPNSVTCSGADPAYALISKRSANHATPYELFIGNGGSLTLHYWGTNIQWPNFSSSGTISTGTWQHVAVTRTFSGSDATVTFYINGVEAGSSTQATGPAQGSSDPVWIARDGYHTGYTSQGSYSGLMDEVQIYNRAVSPAEIARIYTNDSAAITNRVGNWKLDESSGSTASDTTMLTCGGSCSDVYAPGTVVAITGTPAAGSTFAGWNGDADCSDGSVSMNVDKTCTATFTLTLVPSDCGTSNGGNFITAPDGNLCATGTPTAVTGSGPWTWSCTGLNEGTTSACTANIASDVLVAGGMINDSTAPPTAEVFHQTTGTWSSTSNTIAYGTIPTNGICGANMTLLGSGKALFAGGSCGGDDGSVTNATSLYDPATNLWSTGASMSYGRQVFAFVTLANGDAMAIAGCSGGCSGTNVLGQNFWTVGQSAEIYSSTNNNWSTKQTLNTARAGMGTPNGKFVVLQDGKVLVCGGNDAFSTTYTSCEIYDPSANTWTNTASFPDPSGLTGMVLLGNGKVLAALNSSLGAVLFDPATGTWSATGAPLSIQSSANLTKLNDGRVLMTGGYVYSAGIYTMLTTSQIYDPVAGTWTETGPMGSGRFYHFTVLLTDGKVLAGGGLTGTASTWGPPLASAEIFDPATGLWSTTGSMGQARWNIPNALRLPTIDVTAPVVTFTLPANASGTTVNITTLTATDNVAVTGYCLSETDSSSGCSWSDSAQTAYTFASDGIKTLYAFAKDAAGNISLSASATVNIKTDKLLTITRSGTGTGTVTSAPAGIDCGATCSASFAFGTAVVLFQSLDNSSGFSGWGGNCSGTGVCAFSMTTDKSVSATFTLSPLVRNERTGVAYTLLQTACAEASSGDTIRARSSLPAAGLLLNRDIILTIEGGYDAVFSSRTGRTPILGPVIIKDGLIRANGLVIR